LLQPPVRASSSTCTSNATHSYLAAGEHMKQTAWGALQQLSPSCWHKLVSFCQNRMHASPVPQVPPDAFVTAVCTCTCAAVCSCSL
jgi:hypothetical protein